MAEMANKSQKFNKSQMTWQRVLFESDDFDVSLKTSKCMDLLTYRLLICMTWQMKYVQEVDNMPIR